MYSSCFILTIILYVYLICFCKQLPKFVKRAQPVYLNKIYETEIPGTFPILYYTSKVPDTYYRQMLRGFSYGFYFFVSSTVPFSSFVKIRFFFSKPIDWPTHIILYTCGVQPLNGRHVCLENYTDWQPYHGGSFFAWYIALYIRPVVSCFGNQTTTCPQ